MRRANPLDGWSDAARTRLARCGLLALAAALLLWPPAAFPQAQEKERKESKEGKDSKESKETQFTRLRIEVTGGENSAPVEGASVYVKFPKERLLAKDRMVEMNLKTNREGIARATGVPRGKVIIQVVAPGWKPFGQWYDLTHEEQTIKVSLQKPPRWY